MITTNDIVKLLVKDDSLKAGLDYALISWTSTFNRMGKPNPYKRIEKILLGVAAENEFIDYLKSKHIKYELKGRTRWYEVDRYDIGINGTPVDIKANFLDLSSAHIQSKYDSLFQSKEEWFLKCHALVPLDQFNCASDRKVKKNYLFPFIEGYFTIAIVGKTSAEKYSFINSLIGEPLFPKSKNQTISTFIVIENGSEAKMEVLFCDGHTENMEYDIVKIKEMLKLIVSVPEEYSKLPISQINQLIAEDSDIDIILEQKANIEKMAKKPEVDEELWRKYVNSHTKKDIPEKIMVSFPLPNEFDGWRIINTPDVSATGEIQEVTKMLFNERDNDNNKTVDAVVYLQDSSCSLEDDSTHDSMEKVCNGLTEEAKDRLFFVLAQATREQSIGSEDFIIEKKKTLQKAQELYSDILNIPQDRFICIDILLERFNNEVKDKVNFGILPCPSNWDVEEWNSMANIYTQIEIQIKRNEFQPCGESFGKITKEWSGFDDLKLLLDEFVRKEKSDIYDNICTCIKKDLDSFEKPLS